MENLKPANFDEFISAINSRNFNKCVAELKIIFANLIDSVKITNAKVFEIFSAIENKTGVGVAIDSSLPNSKLIFSFEPPNLKIKISGTKLARATFFQIIGENKNEISLEISAENSGKKVEKNSGNFAGKIWEKIFF